MKNVFNFLYNKKELILFLIVVTILYFFYNATSKYYESREYYYNNSIKFYGENNLDFIVFLNNKLESRNKEKYHKVDLSIKLLKLKYSIENNVPIDFFKMNNDFYNYEDEKKFYKKINNSSIEELLDLSYTYAQKDNINQIGISTEKRFFYNLYFLILKNDRQSILYDKNNLIHNLYYSLNYDYVDYMKDKKSITVNSLFNEKKYLFESSLNNIDKILEKIRFINEQEFYQEGYAQNEDFVKKIFDKNSKDPLMDEDSSSFQKILGEQKSFFFSKIYGLNKYDFYQLEKKSKIKSSLCNNRNIIFLDNKVKKFGVFNIDNKKKNIFFIYLKFKNRSIKFNSISLDFMLTYKFKTPDKNKYLNKTEKVKFKKTGLKIINENEFFYTRSKIYLDKNVEINDIKIDNVKIRNCNDFFIDQIITL